MIYSIALYLLLIFPISLNRYKCDGRKWLFIKIMNFLITLYVFVLLSGNFKRFITGLSDNSYLILKDVPVSLNIAFSGMYTILSIIAGVQIIKLALRVKNGRIFFIWLIPLIWIFTGIDEFFAYKTIYHENPTLEYEIFINIIRTIFWLSIFLFYSSNRFKFFISATDQKKGSA